MTVSLPAWCVVLTTLQGAEVVVLLQGGLVLVEVSSGADSVALQSVFPVAMGEWLYLTLHLDFPSNSYGTVASSVNCIKYMHVK